MTNVEHDTNRRIILHARYLWLWRTYSADNALKIEQTCSHKKHYTFHRSLVRFPTFSKISNKYLNHFLINFQCLGVAIEKKIGLLPHFWIFLQRNILKAQILYESHKAGKKSYLVLRLQLSNVKNKWEIFNNENI